MWVILGYVSQSKTIPLDIGYFLNYYIKMGEGSKKARMANGYTLSLLHYFDV